MALRSAASVGRSGTCVAPLQGLLHLADLAFRPAKLLSPLAEHSDECELLQPELLHLAHEFAHGPHSFPSSRSATGRTHFRTAAQSCTRYTPSIEGAAWLCGRSYSRAGLPVSAQAREVSNLSAPRREEG